jgi:hypothetical protein
VKQVTPAGCDKQVDKAPDTQQAALALVCEAYRLWLQTETRTDDITAIVIRVDELEGTNGLTSEGLDLQKPPA